MWVGCRAPRPSVSLSRERILEVMSGLDLTQTQFATDRCWRILLKKSVLAEERNFSGPLMGFARGDVRRPHRFAQKRPRTSVSALRSFAAVERSKNRLSRDFPSRSIFDFCNSIGGAKRTFGLRNSSLVSGEEFPILWMRTIPWGPVAGAKPPKMDGPQGTSNL